MRSLLVLCLVVGACKSKETDAPASKPAEPPSVPESTKLQPGTTASGIDLSKLGGQLKKEAENRPKGVITSEQVFDALDKAGVTTSRRQQILALSAGAAYCADARTDKGPAVVVCEYTSAAEAEQNLKLIEQRFAMGANAVRKLHGATMLTVVGPKSDTTDKILSTFAALEPRTASSGS
jgi:hypothetical protein